jgi:hypothetical protein
MNLKPSYKKLENMAALKWSARSLMNKNGVKFMRFDLLCYTRGYDKIDMYFFCN